MRLLPLVHMLGNINATLVTLLMMGELLIAAASYVYSNVQIHTHRCDSKHVNRLKISMIYLYTYTEAPAAGTGNANIWEG